MHHGCDADAANQPIAAHGVASLSVTAKPPTLHFASVRVGRRGWPGAGRNTEKISPVSGDKRKKYAGSLFADLWLDLQNLPGSFKTFDSLGVKFLCRDTCVDPNREITFG